MSCTVTYATLRIFSEDTLPDKITSVLNIAPTSQDIKDPNSKYKARRFHNFWSWSTERQIKSNLTTDHVEAIINLIKNKPEAVTKLRNRKCKIDIFCFWEFDGQGTISLPSNLMQKLCELELEISWDIYFEDGADV